MRGEANSRYLVQVWAAPALPVGFNLELPSTPPIRLLGVEAVSKTGKTFPCTFVEMHGTQQEMGTDADKDFRRIGSFLSRLGFVLLTRFSVFDARLIPKDLSEGDKFRWLVFSKGSAPPGISLFEQKVGFAKTRELNPAFLTKFLSFELASELEGAITWFHLGLFAVNSIEQILYHWIGLEMLAPSLTGPWQCNSCGAELAACPECGNSTVHDKAAKPIRDFLRDQLGVSGSEFHELYRVRNKIAHGHIPMDAEGIQKVAQNGFRIQQLLFDSIKKAVGMPLEGPPLIEPKGVTIMGKVALHTSGPKSGYSPDLYKHPSGSPEDSG